jgi:hypothetical protein
MIVVIDQFVPEYVERFDMANVRALMDGGVNFKRAILGHMAAETVITHNVLTSGVLPKHQGWVNEVYRDVDGVLGPAGSYQVTSSLSCGQFETLLKAQDYPKLDDQLGGNRFAVGNDPAHLGGDVWTADAAITLMENEADWRGMMVTFGSVDKAAHMWGTEDGGPSGVGADVHEQAHLPFAARIADLQVGKLLAALEAQGIRDETLVVLTTDHGGQTAHSYHGLDGADRGNFNWYYGADGDESYLSPQPALAPLVATGNVDFSYQDGHIATWLGDRSPGKLAEAAAAIRSMPDVIASYVRDGDRYRRVGPTGDMSGRERAWWVRWGQELIDTMAAPSGPDVVGLLRDDVSYGVAGDHGGHQEAIQHVPMAFSWPGLRPQARQERFRAVDVVPTALRLMGIDPVAGTDFDGIAYRLKPGR